MDSHSIGKQLVFGAAAGLAGTFVIQTLLKASGKYAPQTMPPIKQEPGGFMVEKAEELVGDEVSSRIPESVEKGSAMALGLGYGMTFGLLYAAIGPRLRSRPRSRIALIFRDGAVLGLIAWAAGYLGWLPAAGLMPPLWKQKPAQALTPPLEHAAFGAATVAAYDLLAAKLA